MLKEQDNKLPELKLYSIFNSWLSHSNSGTIR